MILSQGWWNISVLEICYIYGYSLLDNVLHEANMMDRKKGQTTVKVGQQRKWIQGVRREKTWPGQRRGDEEDNQSDFQVFARELWLT